jgi:2-iminoacetate synthase
MKTNFYNEIERFDKFDFAGFFENVTEEDVEHVLAKEVLGELDLLSLLSKQALLYLEPLANRARQVTIANFGKVISLYAPLYLSNYCDNDCLYCGFKSSNIIQRRKLSLDEVRLEAKNISGNGIKHILILTGESRKESPLQYVKECVQLLREYFTSISIEIYPLKEEEYAELIASGADGLTIYQETYNKKLYGELHKSGPKSDYIFRLDAPQRACCGHIRQINIGALLGLSDFQKEAFFLGMHGRWLENNYPDVEIGVSLPRIQPQVGNFSPEHPVSDKELVQILLALRIFLPRVSITISTRENSVLRKNLIGLGVTRMSAGSKTEVGGYAHLSKTEGQFEIADKSSVLEVKEMICQKGYQPVLKDWLNI